MTTTAIPADTVTSSTQRRAMIDSQLRTSGVNEEYVLSRMMAVPREQFLPAEKAPLAYIDRSIIFDGGNHLASPLFYGKLLIEADARKSERVLIVEGGTAYLTELLRPLVKEIDTISADDAAAGKLPAGKTYSLVLIDGAIEQLPDAIASVIEDGGRIVTGLLLRKVTRLASGRKIAGHLSLQPVEDLGIPVLSQFNATKGWSF